MDQAELAEAKRKKLKDLAELFEVEVSELGDGFELDSDEFWDSLAIVTTVSAVHKYYNTVIKGEDIADCATIGDLFSYIEDAVA